MPGKKGTIKAEDGNYYKPEEMVKLNLKPLNPKNRSLLSQIQSEKETELDKKEPPKKRRRRKTVKKEEETPEVYSVSSAQCPEKMSGCKSSSNELYPRVTITTFEGKGKHIKTTFVVKPESFRVNKSEDVSYTTSGKPKKHLFVNMEFDVLEIE